MNNQKNSTNPLLLIGMGVVAGWLAKRFLESPAMKDKRDQAIASAEELRDRLMDPDQVDHLKDLFGDATDDVKGTYETAQKQLVKELAALKTTFADIDKTKYVKVVTDIILKLKDDQTLPDAELNKLKTALEEDFDKLQKNRVAEAKSEVKRTVKKTVKKAKAA